MCGGEKVGQMPYLCPTGRSATAWDLSRHPNRSVPYHWYVCRSNKYGSSGQTTELICSTSITYQSLTDKVYKWTFYIRGSPGFADIRGSQSCQMEDGSPGFADIRGSQSQLCLWLRNVNMEVGAGWERGTSFWELGTLSTRSWLWGGSSRCYFCEEWC